jgi:hypothetical protein
LPVTFDTCEVVEERWANWLRHDPVVAIETQADNLLRLKALYIDCGEKDQFNLLYGARRFVRRLNEVGSPRSRRALGAVSWITSARCLLFTPLQVSDTTLSFFHDPVMPHVAKVSDEATPITDDDPGEL